MKRLLSLCGMAFVNALLVATTGRSQVVLENRGVAMPILEEADFARLYRRNPSIPTQPERLFSLTNLLLGRNEGAEAEAFVVLSADGEQDEASNVGCGEHLYGTLFTALQNPDLDEAVRDQVVADMDSAVPELGEPVKIGHFRFFYKTSDDDPNALHAVTHDDVKATAEVLNKAWDDFAANFREPKHRVIDGEKIVDVRIYDLPKQGLYGVTASMWDHIELDSIETVANECRRQTTPVHELFHRVQYAYGYASGAEKMKWAVEATASWSQKLRAQHVGDYMDRMKFGLETPDFALLDRSYDAAHLWIYLGQRAGNEMEFVRDCWKAYQGNGMLDPVRSVTTAKIGLDFDACIAEWHYANLRKDVKPVDARFTYLEDDDPIQCGDEQYGPLKRVARQSQMLNAAHPTRTVSGVVATYGADHHRFILPPGTSKIKLTVTPNDGEAVMCGCTAVNVEDLVDEVLPSVASPFAYERDFAGRPVTEVLLTVVGAPKAAGYKIVAELPSP